MYIGGRPLALVQASDAEIDEILREAVDFMLHVFASPDLRRINPTQAEGTETEDDVRYLAGIGCNLFQG